MLQSDKEPVTASRLSKMTGLTDGQVLRNLKKLTKLELVERLQILNKQGRGRAFHLAIKHNAKARRLMKAIEKGGGKKR
jgi:predicted ArsR family transcriptional regulator